MSRTLQFKRYDGINLANTIGANGELIINTTNKTLTVHDGAFPGGYPLLNQSTDMNIDQTARTTANTANTTANLAYANSVNTITITTLKTLVANAATYTDFQTAIAAL